MIRSLEISSVMLMNVKNTHTHTHTHISETELTADVLKKYPKTHIRLKRIRQDRMQIFTEILFFKAMYNTKTNK